MIHSREAFGPDQHIVGTGNRMDPPISPTRLALISTLDDNRIEHNILSKVCG
jgi:hypothetical protein